MIRPLTVLTRLVGVALLSGLPAGDLSGQAAAGPPVRTLGRAEAFSSISFEGIDQIRVLSDGRVLVHDVFGKRVVMLDRALAKLRTIMDSVPGQPNSHRSGGLLYGVGDTSLYVDRGANIILTIEPDGTLGRTLPAPAGGSIVLSYITVPQPVTGVARVSSTLGLVFRGLSLYSGFVARS